MNLYRFYQAKYQNRKTVDLLRVLSHQERVKSLPNHIGSHYRKMDPNNKDYDPIYAANYSFDKPLWEVLNCCNVLEGKLAYNKDFVVTGAKHCGNKYLCACCGTREARRVSSQLRYMFLLNQNKGYKYFMLTLTLPNRFDGFRTEFDIYNKAMPLLSTYFGFHKCHMENNSCQGYFGAKELTYSKDKGFHPHLHLILAFDSSRIRDIKYTRNGFVKSMVIKNGREKEISTLSIRDKFIDLIRHFYPDYYYNNELKLVNCNIGFEPLSSVDDCVDEVCKYLIDYNSFKDVDSLFIYLRDIYKLKKYHKTGCFGWSEDLEDQWRKWCEDGKPGLCNLHFIEFAQSKGLVYFGYRWGLDSNNKPLYVPYVYSRNQLYNNGQTVALTFDHRSGVYRYLAYSNLHNKLIDGFVTSDLTDMLVNYPRRDVTDYVKLYSKYVLLKD